MHLLLSLCVVWLLPMAWTLEGNSLPRRIISYQQDNVDLFQEEGVFNYSTMLLREDLGLLVIGAREAVYAVDLHNVSIKFASVKWEATQAQTDDCGNKGKDPETECKNYIRVLHEMGDNRMYVCGTNAFDPQCDFMSYADGTLTLENKAEDGKGKCPFDPYQKFASLMVDDDLYSATSMDFQGSKSALLRSLGVSIRTGETDQWLKQPDFVSLVHIPESVNSATGDDDKVYLFFSETAVEYDYYNKVVVSRVARVCKGDLGDRKTHRKKWTSFLKARLECPILESQSLTPYIIQDAYRWCDPFKPWTDCLIFTIFTPQDASDLSAVCVYNMLDISRVFTEGKYKTPVTVETSFVKWVMYSGEVPFPRPGACIDDAARKANINQTLDLPDKTLLFVKEKPLMDNVIQPVGKKPSLVRKGATFTRIIVNQVQAADDRMYHVMFIGTENGTVVKAVNYDGEMFIIEELHVFKSPEAIKILRFSIVTDQLYAGSDSGVVQIPVATCDRSSTCIDCVLNRDPYCGWDKETGTCVALSQLQKKLIQSVQDGDASLCPKSAPNTIVNQSIWVGGNLKLHCTNPSIHAATIWEQDGRTLSPTGRHYFLKDDLLIINTSDSDAGLYSCLSVERSKTNEYTSTLAEYQVNVASSATGRGDDIGFPHAQRDSPNVAGLRAVIAVFVIAFLGLFAWNLYNGHFTRSCIRRDKSKQLSPESHEEMAIDSSHNQRRTESENNI
ncbi:semaphorin-4E-like [Eucyclogobius newberryi]|uniref:semaphorin-4E-like n=1 Tax=Eucyclogobius newberryi TaxID=166745 RepID=UPI003B5B558C